jgi:uncharacterized membrane protein YagU involved in acid resistance
MWSRAMGRFVISMMCVGFVFGVWQSVQTHHVQIAAERLRDPNHHICGLFFFAEIAGGLVWAILAGATATVVSLGLRRILMSEISEV